VHILEFQGDLKTLNFSRETPNGNSQEAAFWLPSCQLCARPFIWWLNISEVINDFVRQCPECQHTLIPHREPQITSPLPQYPCEKVASDLFHLNGHTYLIVMYYFSYSYPDDLYSSHKGFENHFSQHGTPSVFVAHNLFPMIWRHLLDLNY